MIARLPQSLQRGVGWDVLVVWAGDVWRRVSWVWAVVWAVVWAGDVLVVCWWCGPGRRRR